MIAQPVGELGVDRVLMAVVATVVNARAGEREVVGGQPGRALGAVTKQQAVARAAAVEVEVVQRVVVAMELDQREAGAAGQVEAVQADAVAAVLHGQLAADRRPLVVAGAQGEAAVRDRQRARERPRQATRLPGLERGDEALQRAVSGRRACACSRKVAGAAEVVVEAVVAAEAAEAAVVEVVEVEVEVEVEVVEVRRRRFPSPLSSSSSRFPGLTSGLYGDRDHAHRASIPRPVDCLGAQAVSAEGESFGISRSARVERSAVECTSVAKP